MTGGEVEYLGGLDALTAICGKREAQMDAARLQSTSKLAKGPPTPLKKRDSDHGIGREFTGGRQGFSHCLNGGDNRDTRNGNLRRMEGWVAVKGNMEKTNQAESCAGLAWQAR